WLLLTVFFFFSSRRRHTRSKRDWSSDVCSSDLVIMAVPFLPGPVSPPAVCGESPTGLAFSPPTRGVTQVTAMITPCVGEGQQQRSEERRVGKEGRNRGASARENNEKKRDKK